MRSDIYELDTFLPEKTNLNRYEKKGITFFLGICIGACVSVLVSFLLASKEKDTLLIESHCPRYSPYQNNNINNNNTVLSPLSSLLLDEIPMKNIINLDDPKITNLSPYSIYKTPSEDWFEESMKIFEKNKRLLQNANIHVDDPEQRLTIVTSLFDLGRGDVNETDFRVKFDEYIQRFQRVIDIDFPMILFMDAKTLSLLDTTSHTKGIILIPVPIEKLEKAFPNYLSRIDQINNSELYKKQAQHNGFKDLPPQAKIKGYQLFIIIKPFLLRWASQLNPWRTQYFMYIDASDDCIGALHFDHLNLLRRLMGRVLFTFSVFQAGIDEQTNGMSQKAYRSYIGSPHNDSNTWEGDNECCFFVEGGILGGTPAYIDVMSQIYNQVLSQSLAEGYLGTEENLLTILFYRFPQLFNAYRNIRDGCDLFVDSTQAYDVDKKIYFQGKSPASWNNSKNIFDKDSGFFEPIVQLKEKAIG